MSHAGVVLVGVEAAGHTAGEFDQGLGIGSVQLYLLLYAVLVIGSFGIVTVVAGDEPASLETFRGLAKRKPLVAVAFTVFLLAQAGVPFTSGFVAKFGVIQAAVSENSYAIAIIAMVAAVVAAFLYLRIMVSMWLHDADESAATFTVPVSAAVAIGIAVVFTIAVGRYPSWQVDLSDSVQLAR